jgi:superfamily II DNA/RNA helicase
LQQDSNTTQEEATFDDLGLDPGILKAITERGYTKPTPIQEQAIPIVLMGRDVMGLAQTGTGKTAAFTLPMIEILAGGRAKARMPRSLVLEPTRELAAQVADNFDVYGKYHKLHKALLVGGESLIDQKKILDKGVDVLIATPGRLLDLFDRGAVLLNDIKILVIDEADRMLDMGFIPDIEKIVARVPPLRQTLLFSATMPPEIKRLSDRFLSNPRKVSVAPPASPAETVSQMLVWTRDDEKMRLLDKIIRQEDVKNAFIFCNRKKDIGGLTRWLERKGYSAGCLHGDMVQAKRYETLDAFKEGKLALLVCSDVAARGIDIKGLSHVFNYDVPMSADDYVHRIGRTGRAGQSGRAWMLATSRDSKYVQSIEKLIGRAIPVEKVEGSGEAPSEEEESAGSSRRGASSGRGRDRGGRERGADRHGRDRSSRDREGTRDRDAGREREPRAPREAQGRGERTRQPQQRPERHRDEQRRPEPGRDRPRRPAEPENDTVGFGDDIPGFLR